MLETKPETVADIMTRKIVAASAQDAIENIEDGMRQYHFRHLPVVDGEQKLVGLVTHRDLLHASSTFLSAKQAERNEVIQQVKVGKIMQTELLTVRASDSVREAAQMMLETKVGCLLVTEEDNTLIGIVTESDFIKLSIWFLDSTEVVEAD
jgi:CBS domain-containing membrane protein